MEEKKKKSKIKKIIIGIVIGVLASIAIIIAIAVLAYWLFIASIVEKSSKSDTSNYESELFEQGVDRYGLFPEHIPSYATDVEFKSNYGIHSNESSVTLEMTLPEQDIEEYLEMYKDELYEKKDFSKFMLSRVKTFVGASKPDYTISGNRFQTYEMAPDALGFIIDTDENRIFFYWDEYRCPSASQLLGIDSNVITNNPELEINDEFDDETDE